jgi:hypothetical protein
MTDKEEKGKAKEPQLAYKTGEKVITVSSLSGLEEQNRNLTRNYSPLQRMEYLYKLNQNLFGFDWNQQAEVLRKGIIHIRKSS